MVTVGIDPHKHVHVAVRQALTDMTAEIDDLNRRVRGLDTTIKELISSPAPSLLEITGISHTSAAVLVAEIGDITRFPTSAKLARYTGRAPIPVYSSDKERHRLHRGGNPRLNSVLYTAAIVQKRFHPAAQELLARHEPAKGTRGARRILKRHLIDVLRQYFPKATGLSIHNAGHLTHIAARLDSRPRKTLGWETPAERLAELLAPAS